MSKTVIAQRLPKLELPRKPVYLQVKEDINFFDLFLRIENDCSHCFLLESLDLANPQSRYDVIGFAPEALLWAGADRLFWQKEGESLIEIPSKNPYQSLAEWMPQNIISRNYAGGLVGYLGYDASNFFEPVLALKYHEHFAPLFFGLYTDGLIYDKFTGEIFYFYYSKNRLDLVKEYLGSQTKALPSFRAKSLGFSCTRARHKEMAAEVLEEIKAGKSFQCQIGFQENYELEGKPLPFYEELRQVNPSPHMYYMKFDKNILIGSSPELVFRLQQKEMESFPLAGTTARAPEKNADMQLARQLLNDPKEIAEHNMLVDLHRNDIGRAARFASVRVRRLMDIKKFSHVQHISSEVVGLIRRDYDMFSGLAATFPAGTLSGAPKIESMKIIERLEQSPRGPYGGAVGHFAFNGDCTFAIPIRTFFVHGAQGFARASGGIVYDSTAENEYLEIQRKLAVISQTMEKFI